MKKKPSDPKKAKIKDLPKKAQGTSLKDSDLEKVVGGTVPKLRSDAVDTKPASLG